MNPDDSGVPNDPRELAQAILADPRYERSLIERLRAGTAGEIKSLLLRYARQSHDSEGRAQARRLLKAARISWEEDGS